MASLAGMLWTNRNNIVWRNSDWNAGHILAIAGSSLKQWKDAQQMLNPSAPNTSHSTKNVTRWIKPMAGWLKMNVNAAVFNARGLIGLGWVLRDAARKFKAAKASPLLMQISPHEAEALVM